MKMKTPTRLTNASAAVIIMTRRKEKLLRHQKADTALTAATPLLRSLSIAISAEKSCRKNDCEGVIMIGAAIAFVLFGVVCIVLSASAGQTAVLLFGIACIAAAIFMIIPILLSRSPFSLIIRNRSCSYPSAFRSHSPNPLFEI